MLRLSTVVPVESLGPSPLTVYDGCTDPKREKEKIDSEAFARRFPRVLIGIYCISALGLLFQFGFGRAVVSPYPSPGSNYRSAERSLHFRPERDGPYRGNFFGSGDAAEKYNVYRIHEYVYVC